MAFLAPRIGGIILGGLVDRNKQYKATTITAADDFGHSDTIGDAVVS